MAVLAMLFAKGRGRRTLPLGLRVSLVLLLDHLALQCRQLIAVAEHLSDQQTLCADNTVLLYHQKGQQSIRNEEHNRQQRKQTVLGFDWEIRVSDERQEAPRFCPTSRQAQNCSLQANNGNSCKPLIRNELTKGEEAVGNNCKCNALHIKSNRLCYRRVPELLTSPQRSKKRARRASIEPTFLPTATWRWSAIACWKCPRRSCRSWRRANTSRRDNPW